MKERPIIMSAEEVRAILEKNPWVWAVSFEVSQ